MIQYNKDNIRVFQSSLYMTTSAVVETDNAIIMTDPNWLPHEVEQIRNYIDEIKGDKQLYIIFTHSDFDHIIGSGAFPDAKVIASQELNENEYKEVILDKVNKFDQGYYLQRNYKPEYPKVDFIISKNAQKMSLGKCELTFYKAPGHTNDGLFTVIEPYGILLTGDYLSDVEFPFIFSSYLDYLKTMKRAEEIYIKHDIYVQVPGHGHTTENIEEMRNRLEFSQEYLRLLLNDQYNMEEVLNNKYTFFDGMKDCHINNKKMAAMVNEKANKS